MTGFDFSLESRQLGFLKKHVMGDKGFGRRGGSTEQLPVGTEIFRLAPAAAIKNAFTPRTEAVGTDQYCIGINDQEKIFPADMITVHLQKLLVQPSGTVPAGRGIMDVFFGKRQNSSLIDKDTAFA